MSGVFKGMWILHKLSLIGRFGRVATCFFNHSHDSSDVHHVWSDMVYHMTCFAVRCHQTFKKKKIKKKNCREELTIVVIAKVQIVLDAMLAILGALHRKSWTKTPIQWWCFSNFLKFAWFSQESCGKSNCSSPPISLWMGGKYHPLK